MRSGAAIVGMVLLAGPVRAEAPARGEGRLPAATVNRLVGKLLPATFEVPDEVNVPARVTVSEARYCGALDPGRGRLVAVLRPAGSTVVRPLLGGGRDCKDKLAQIVQRRAGEAVAVAEILVEWAPWRLRVGLGEVVTGGDEGARLGLILARAKAAGPLASVPTSALRLAAPGGAVQSYDLALAFARGDAVALAITPAGRASGREAASADAGEPAVTASYALANGLLSLYTKDQPLTLEFESQAVEIRSLQVSGSDGALTVQGHAQPRGVAEAAQLAIEAVGADLTISAVRADAEQEDCSGLGILEATACRVRNGARMAAAAALAAGLSNHYRGQPLRALAPLPPASFELGGRRFDLRLTPTRMAATGAGISVAGKVEVDPAP